MKLALYTHPLSPPGRAVELTCKALNLDYEVIVVDIGKREQYKPEFLKLNPLHTIPTLVIDENLVLVESHAIIVYLVNKFGQPNNPLYPDDLVTRSRIDQFLHFETGILFARLRNITEGAFLGEKYTPQDKIDYANKGLGLLEVALERGSYLVGDSVTLADISVVTTAVSLEAMFPGTLANYPLITAWVRRLEKSIVAYHEINQRGASVLGVFYRELLERNRAKSP